MVGTGGGICITNLLIRYYRKKICITHKMKRKNDTSDRY